MADLFKITVFTIVLLAILAIAANNDVAQAFQSPISPLPSPTPYYTPWPTPGWEALMPSPTPAGVGNGPASEHHTDPVEPIPEVPEPTTLLLFGGGLIVVWAAFRRRN